MTVLLIDDQINILAGLRSAIRWDRLGIRQVLTAQGGEEAREALRRHRVDIALCDIEMPGEDGITLIRWVREHYPAVKCLFLTSHADFDYARQAVNLGSLEYILQPATNAEIEEALRKAVKRVEKDEAIRELSRIGTVFRKKEGQLVDGIMREILAEGWDGGDGPLAELAQLEIPLGRETPVLPVLVSPLAWGEHISREEPGLFKAVLTNILTDLCAPYRLACFCARPDQDYYLFLYPLEEQARREAPVSTLLGELREHVEHHFGMSLACYAGEFVEPAGLSGQCRRLYLRGRDNVRLVPGVYLHARGQEEPAPLSARQADYDLERWADLLAGGHTGAVKSDLERLWQRMEKEDADYFLLFDFHRQFTQMLLRFLHEKQVDFYSVFGTEFSYLEYMEGYANLHTLKNAMNRVLEALERSSVLRSRSLTEIEKAKKLISKNFHRELTVAEVAAHVNMSPEYFTRYFKKETGCGIKEYILQSKFAVACDLLENTNLSVSIIACQIGYSNFSHFSQIFRKHIGASPVDYRKSAQTKSESRQ